MYKNDRPSFVPVPDCIQIQNNKIIYRKAYEEFSIKRKTKLLKKDTEKNLKDGKPSGVMTRNIRGKIKRIIRNFIDILKYSPYDENGHKLNMPTFVTLTLPCDQMHSDKELYRILLNEFLITIKRKKDVKNFVWRAEKQDNGNLHYHLVLDKFIDYLEVKRIWNSILKKHGYIEKYAENQRLFHKDGFRQRPELFSKWPQVAQYHAFKKGQSENWENPNSTDIHALKNIVDVESYICKYMSKDKYDEKLREIKLKMLDEKEDKSELIIKENEIKKALERERINGRVWGCSDEIKDLKDVVYIDDIHVENLVKDLIKSEEVMEKKHETMTIFYCKNIKKYIEKYTEILKYIRKIRRKQYYNLYLKDIKKYKVKEKTLPLRPPKISCIQRQFVFN